MCKMCTDVQEKKKVNWTSTTFKILVLQKTSVKSEKTSNKSENKTFAKHISERGFVCRICRELLYLNKTTGSIKNRSQIYINISPN